MDDCNSSDSYINEIDLQPPSPDPNNPLDLYPANDYVLNSPFSTHSDLSFGDGQQLGGLFPDDPYDPAEFDNPHSGQSLLMFDGPPTDYYDYYHSPSPSGSENNEDTHSGISSASSANTQFYSPNLSMAQSFENLSFHSPSCVTDPLPPQQKPTSPPRLIMPDQPQPQPPIIINAPEDNLDLGPSLHIVPATPISGGAGVVNIASSQVPRRSWLEPNAHSNDSSRAPSPAHSLAATPPMPSRSPSSSPQPPNTTLLYTQQSRSRSKSDTSLEPPNWGTVTGGQGFPHNHPSQQAYHAHGRPPTLGNNFTFGSSPPSHNNINQHTNNTFLSPEHAESVTAGGSLRRSKSDATGNAGLPRHRGSRSEDFRHVGPAGNAYLSAPQSGQFLCLPTAHGDYVRSQQQQQQFFSQLSDMVRMPPSHSHSQSLSTSMLPHSLSNPTNLPTGRHYRRASSGTRSERGLSAGTWDSEVVGSNRPSPYPSPNASPRGRLAALGAERQDEYNFGGIDSLGISIGRNADDSRGPVPYDPGRIDRPAPLVVSKPNVTTGRTANASQKRRKQDATFVCPVPGCGSTFTRSFNLKGHIRSHKEEKPFQCHWPGCNKGFARQHDCKRHEQLHTNYRPFNCDGCKKQFARMDALNRHHRSEGGAECAKLQEGNGGSTSATSTPPSSADTRSSPAGKNEALTASPSLSAAPMAKSFSSSSAYRQKQEPLGYGIGNGGIGLGVLEDGPSWGVGGGSLSVVV